MWFDHGWGMGGRGGSALVWPMRPLLVFALLIY